MHRFALFVALPATALSTGVRKQIYVDAAVPGGAISMATGVDKGPFCTDAPVNLTTELREVGTTFIRTHDAGTIDWSVNFPFPALDADTENPANYVWAAGDATMAAILDNGFVPYLRLGNSWTHPPWSAAPANLTALSRVLLNTVRHYNDGWGGGGFSSRQVRWIELWNVRWVSPGVLCVRRNAVGPPTCAGARWRTRPESILEPQLVRILRTHGQHGALA